MHTLLQGIRVTESPLQHPRRALPVTRTRVRYIEHREMLLKCRCLTTFHRVGKDGMATQFYWWCSWGGVFEGLSAEGEPLMGDAGAEACEVACGFEGVALSEGADDAMEDIRVVGAWEGGAVGEGGHSFT